MHCPESMAWRIVAPWYKTLKFANGRKQRHHPSLVEAWHMDKDNADRNPPCNSKWWRWHIHHYYRVNFLPWMRFKQRHITKCSWCGNKSNKEQGLVNFSEHRTLYHAKCIGEHSAAFHAHDPDTCWSCQHKGKRI